MTAAYDCLKELYDEILVNVPGATENVIKLAIKTTLREFLNQSAAWRVELRPFDVLANKEDYYLDPPYANTRILYVHHAVARLDDGWVPMHNLTEKVYRVNSTASATGSRPMYFKGYADVPGKIAITPRLSEDFEAGVIPTVSLTFRDPWDGKIPQFIMRYWREVINDGVWGRLMSQQDKPYSNAAMSQYHLRRFRSGIARARDMAERQYTEADHDVQFPRFAQ